MTLSTESLYVLAGVLLLTAGLRGALLQPSLLGRVLAMNIGGSGVFVILIAAAYRGPSRAPDAVPHALVLTGIVVSVSATALALALGRRLRGTEDGGD